MPNAEDIEEIPETGNKVHIGHWYDLAEDLGPVKIVRPSARSMKVKIVNADGNEIEGLDRATFHKRINVAQTLLMKLGSESFLAGMRENADTPEKVQEMEQWLNQFRT